MGRRLILIFTFALAVIVRAQAAESSTPDYYDESEDPPSTHVPVFTTESKTFTKKEGESVNLRCDVDKIGSYTTVWEKGVDEILFAEAIEITTDPSFTREADRSLTIKNLIANHSGVYTCSISSEPKIRLVHHVNVLVPPKIIRKPKHEISLRKNQVLNLTCEATGNPPPAITWKKLEGTPLPNGSPLFEGGSFVVKEAKRVHTGKYECMANNGIGMQDIANVKVHVLYPPDIEVENPVVHSGEGVSSELSCSIHADPNAHMYWEKNGKKITTSDHHRTTHSHIRHTLHIKRVKPEDFGTYICVAKNALGTSRQPIELSGLATPIVFKSHPNGNELESYDLIWATTSYSGVIDYVLKLREKSEGEENNEWSEGIIIPAESQSGLMQSQKYTITGLKPATSYEVIMQANNKYGLNKESNVFSFATQGREITSNQPFEDASDMAAEQGDENSTLKDAVEPPSKREENGDNAAAIPEPVAVRIGLFSLLTVFILSSFF